MKFWIIYLIVINLLALLMMLSDKLRAREHNRRIPEKALFLSAILGGSLGSVIGMWAFRHKTRHWYFVIGMPAILLVQLVLAILIL